MYLVWLLRSRIIAINPHIFTQNQMIDCNYVCSLESLLQHFVSNVNNSEVEIVDSFTFLGIHITSNLSWSLHAWYMCKKGQQRLYFLRCLKKFHMKPEILVNFYRSALLVV